MQHAIADAVAADRAAREGFLAELVRVPSDNPPGDCAPAAERAAVLLEELGFAVERHPVPAERVREVGMRSATNLIVRRRFGDGPVIALNAHGDVVPPGRGLVARSVRRGDRRWLDVWSRCRGLEIRFC